MQRYNLFRQIHKGLKALLYDTALSLQQTEFTDASQSEAALERLFLVVELFEAHAFNEDTYILPAVARFEQSLVEEFENEHEEDLKLSKDLETVINIFRSCGNDAEKIIAGSGVCKAYMDFMIFNLKHMAKEEMILNQSLWRNYTDAELLAIDRSIVSNVAPEDMAVYSKWMIKGMSDYELVYWLNNVKQSAPSFVFDSLLNIAGNELPANRWSKIQDAVEETAVLA